jgi:hypothetical protein
MVVNTTADDNTYIIITTIYNVSNYMYSLGNINS